MRREVATMGLVALLAPVLAAAAKSGGRPPNVLLVTTDDQGLHAGCYGDPLALTPNLDRLAAEGVLFENAYVSAATCSPSRSTILTGLYPHQNGHIGLEGFHPEYALKPGIPTLPALLKQAGYATGIIGKLHVGPAAAFPFDFMWREALQEPVLTRDVRKVAELAGAFIEQSGERPFFLYVNYFDPHRPFDAESNQCKGLPEKPYAAADVEPFGFLGDAANLRDVAAYYNCVNRLDIGLGLVFDRLKAMGKYEDTLILFISDNGPDFTRAKVTSYEAGIHVPFIVKWPGISQAGLRSDAYVSAVDIVPTLLDASGIDCPPVAGHSLREVLQGKTPEGWRDELFAEYTSHDAAHFYPRRSLRNDPWKLIHNLDFERANPVPRRGAGQIAQLTDPVWIATFATDLNPPEWELYNLAKDPFETVNLAGNPEWAAVLMKLKAELMNWRQKTDDPLLDPGELERMRKAHGFE